MIEALKVNHKTYPIYIEALPEGYPEHDESQVSGYIVVRDSRYKSELFYFDPLGGDFHEHYKWVGGKASEEGFSEVQPIDPKDDLIAFLYGSGGNYP